jgi:hypothetical protein
MTNITGGSVMDSNSFISTYDAAMAALYQPIISNGANYYGTQVYLDNPIGSPPRPDTTAANFGPGTGGAGLLPTQVSPLISLYSTTLGKQGQGRTYLPFPPATAIDANGTPSAAYLLNIGALGNFLQSPLVVTGAGGATGTFNLVLYKGGAAPALLVTSALIRDAWGTQRRRGNYGKVNAVPF